MGILKPDMHIRDIHHLDLDALWDKGYRGILLDLDNTFVPYGEYKPIPEESMEWLKRVREKGFTVAIYSNATKWKTDLIAEQTGLFCAHKALKPLTIKLKQCLKCLGCDKSKVVTIGDQLFTDILGGNLAGLFTILVEPVHEKDFWGTKILRALERIAGRKALDSGKS